jgi:hypothetical protein
LIVFFTEQGGYDVISGLDRSCWKLSDLDLVSESIDCRERGEKNEARGCESGCSVKTETNKEQKETNLPSTMLISSCRECKPRCCCIDFN